MKRYHIGHVLVKTLKRFSDKINQTDATTGISETNASILKRSMKLALWLRRNDVKKGDVVMVCAGNHLDACIPVIACALIGATVQPGETNLKYVDLKYFVELGEPKVIFCDTTVMLQTLSNLLEKENIDAKVVTFGKTETCIYEDFQSIIWNISENEIEDFQPLELDPRQTILFIYCTSGSTSFPKGVVITHWAFLHRVVDFWFPEKHSYEDEIFMCGSQLSWITAAAIMMTSCILGSSRIISSEPFTEAVAFKIMKTYRPTLTLLGPSALTKMVNDKDFDSSDWSSLRFVFVAGSALRPKLALAVQEKLINGKVATCYGTTEVIGTIASYHLSTITGEIPVGPIRPVLKAKIVDPDGNELGPRQRGELYVKGDYIFKGYYKNPHESEQALTKDGWFRTGDMLYYNEDNVFFFVDRLKMLIVYQNFPISPVELENVILSHPSVESAAVGKLEVPPDDLPVALVVRKPHALVTEEEIKHLIAENLAPYKQLWGGVLFVDKLPYTGSGKIDRKTVNHQIKSFKLKHG